MWAFPRTRIGRRSVVHWQSPFTASCTSVDRSSRVRSSRRNCLRSRHQISYGRRHIRNCSTSGRLKRVPNGLTPSLWQRGDRWCQPERSSSVMGIGELSTCASRMDGLWSRSTGTAFVESGNRLWWATQLTHSALTGRGVARLLLRRHLRRHVHFSPTTKQRAAPLFQKMRGASAVRHSPTPAHIRRDVAIPPASMSASGPAPSCTSSLAKGWVS